MVDITTTVKGLTANMHLAPGDTVEITDVLSHAVYKVNDLGVLVLVNQENWIAGSNVVYHATGGKVTTTVTSTTTGDTSEAANALLKPHWAVSKKDVGKHTVVSTLAKLVPDIHKTVRCPNRGELAPAAGDARTFTCGSNCSSTLVNLIPHLNDVCGWTREQIADWLETTDLDIQFKEPIEEKQALAVKSEPKKGKSYVPSLTANLIDWSLVSDPAIPPVEDDWLSIKDSHFSMKFDTTAFVKSMTALTAAFDEVEEMFSKLPPSLKADLNKETGEQDAGN